MAAKSNFTNMVLCLTAVCLVCSALLGIVYAITVEPIRIAGEKALKASIGVVLPEGAEISESQIYEIDGTAFEYYAAFDSEVNDSTVAYAVKYTTMGFGGPLTVMVGVLPDGTVFNTSVLSHSETPGLGAKCKDDSGFLGQFHGFGPDKVLKVKKDGGDVDAITASTITSRAYTLAVSNAVNAVKSMAGINVDADAFSGASIHIEEEVSNE